MDATKEWQNAITAYQNALKSKETAEARDGLKAAEKEFLSAQNEAAAKAALERIVSFKPRIDNTVANFIPANNILTDWAKNALADRKPSAGAIPATGQQGKDANSRILLALQD